MHTSNEVMSGVVVEGSEEGVSRLVEDVSVLPAERWNEGDSIGTTPLRRRSCGVRFSVNDAAAFSVSEAAEEVWQSLLSKMAAALYPLVDQGLVSARATFGVTSVDDAMPDIFLSRDLLARYSNAGCGIDVDVILA